MAPLIDMPAGATYKGEDGGLYGGGLNEPPPAHGAAARSELAKIVPLDFGGDPSSSGKIGFISIGMSNTTQEFSAFKRLADADPAKSPRVAIVDGAQGGRDAQQWAETSTPWQVLDQRLQQAGVAPQQVQVAWLKQATPGPRAPFPSEAKRLQGYLATIVQRARERYPNLRIVYLSSRVYAGYATTNLNPEPHAYETAFAVRWLIQEQVSGAPSLNFDPARGAVKSPLLLWGPYLWADGLNPRSDGLVWQRSDLGQDGTHPSAAGSDKVARMLLSFLKTDPLATSWFMR